MGDSYAERAAKEGPLPKVDDDSDLVGEDDKSPRATTGREAPDRVTIQAPGTGSFPAPTMPEEQDGEQAAAEQEAER